MSKDCSPFPARIRGVFSSDLIKPARLPLLALIQILLQLASADVKSL